MEGPARPARIPMTQDVFMCGYVVHPSAASTLGQLPGWGDGTARNRPRQPAVRAVGALRCDWDCWCAARESNPQPADLVGVNAPRAVRRPLSLDICRC
jgi:hypothetical protein